MGNSELDIVIGPIDLSGVHDSDTIVHPMISDKIIAVARDSHPIFHVTKVTQAALNHYPLAVPKTQGSVSQSTGGPKLNEPKVLFDNYSLLKELTVELDLICAGPKAVFEREIEKGQLKIIDIDLEIFWESSLLVRPEILSTPIVEHFVDLCERQAEHFSSH